MRLRIGAHRLGRARKGAPDVPPHGGHARRAGEGVVSGVLHQPRLAGRSGAAGSRRMTRERWRQALSVRGLVHRLVADALRRNAPGGHEFASPIDQPERRNFYRVVNGAAHAIWGPGNYRVASLDDPPRIAVWREPGQFGVPCGAGMSRRAMDVRRVDLSAGEESPMM